MHMSKCTAKARTHMYTNKTQAHAHIKYKSTKATQNGEETRIQHIEREETRRERTLATHRIHHLQQGVLRQRASVTERD